MELLGTAGSSSADAGLSSRGAGGSGGCGRTGS